MEERKRKLDQSRQTVKKATERKKGQQEANKKKLKKRKKRESRNWEWWEKLPQEKEIWEEMIRGKKRIGMM